MKKQMRDAEGRPIPGLYAVKKDPPLFSGDPYTIFGRILGFVLAWSIIIAALLGLWSLIVFLIKYLF